MEHSSIQIGPLLQLVIDSYQLCKWVHDINPSLDIMVLNPSGGVSRSVVALINRYMLPTFLAVRLCRSFSRSIQPLTSRFIAGECPYRSRKLFNRYDGSAGRRGGGYLSRLFRVCGCGCINRRIVCVEEPYERGSLMRHGCIFCAASYCKNYRSLGI